MTEYSLKFRVLIQISLDLALKDKSNDISKL